MSKLNKQLFKCLVPKLFEINHMFYKMFIARIQVVITHQCTKTSTGCIIISRIIYTNMLLYVACYRRKTTHIYNLIKKIIFTFDVIMYKLTQQHKITHLSTAITLYTYLSQGYCSLHLPPPNVYHCMKISL